MVLMEDMYIKEMDNIIVRLRFVEEERQKREEECERLKREINDFFSKLEDLQLRVEI